MLYWGSQVWCALLLQSFALFIPLIFVFSFTVAEDIFILKNAIHMCAHANTRWRNQQAASVQTPDSPIEMGIVSCGKWFLVFIETMKSSEVIWYSMSWKWRGKKNQIYTLLVLPCLSGIERNRNLGRKGCFICPKHAEEKLGTSIPKLIIFCKFSFSDLFRVGNMVFLIVVDFIMCFLFDRCTTSLEWVVCSSTA